MVERVVNMGELQVESSRLKVEPRMDTDARTGGN